MQTKHILLIVALNLAVLILFGYTQKQDLVQHESIVLNTPAPIPQEKPPTITVQTPVKDLTFEEVDAVLAQWNKEAPSITETGIVGTTDDVRSIRYIRIGKKNGPKVLIMATIHGNEKLSTMTSLGIVNRILKGYLVDDKITELLRTRDIYYIPIASPDGYIMNSRTIQGIDPNRNFNGKSMSRKESVATVKAIKAFFDEVKFDAVMSCHNFGRVYFYPWGYTKTKTALDADYRRVLEEMSATSKYRFVQLYGNTAAPLYGYEIDYFHEKGAFAIVNEIGRSFIARKDDIASEIETNYKPFLIFIEKAPLVRPAFYSIIE